MPGPRVRTLVLALAAAAALAAALPAGCGRTPAPPDPAPGASPAVRAAAARTDSLLAAPRAPHPAAFRVRRYTDFLTALRDPARREAAREAFFRAWSADPGDPLLAEVAVLRRWDLGDPARCDSLLTAVAGTDTASALHHFVAGRRAWGRDPQAGPAFRTAGRLAAGRDPFLAVWAEVRAARVAAEAGAPDAGIARLATLAPHAWLRGGPGLAALAWSELSTVARGDQRLDDALVAATLSVRCADAAGNGYLGTRGRVSVALAQKERGRYGAAFDTLAACYATARDSGFTRLLSATPGYLAQVAHASGDLAREIAELRRMVRLTRAAGDTNGLVRASLGLADGLRRRGDLDAAAAWLDRADSLDAAWRGGDVARSIRQARAILANQLGDYAAAESLLVLAAGSADLLRDRDTALLLQVNLVRQGLETDRPDLAYRALARGREIERGNPAAALASDAALHLALAAARLHARQGEHHLADAQLHRAEELVSPADMQQAWFVAETRGKVAREMGDIATARTEFARALERADSLGVPDRIRRSRVDLAAVLLDEGRAREAAALVAGDLAAPEYWTRLHARLVTALAVARAGDHAAALAAYAAVDTALGADPPADLAARLELERGRSLAVLGRTDEAAAHLASAQAALDDPAGAATELGRAFNRGIRREVATALCGLLHDTGGGADASRAAAAWLRRERPAGARGPRVEFLVGADRAFAWWSDGRGGWRWSELPPTASLRQLAADVATDLAYPGREVDAAALARLGEALLGPLADAWPADATLEIAPDGFLAGVPWAALPWPADGAPALDHGPLVITVGPPAPQGGAATARGLLALGVDGGAEDGGPRLAQAEAEARAVAAAWRDGPVDLRLGADADLAGLLAGGEVSCRALHISSHARVYEGADGHSTIRMAGADADPLTVAGVQAATVDAALVYLSSCEGARRHRSAGRGVVSFAEAFLTAGAERVVATSVLVDDAAGRAVAEAFYDHWLRGETPAAALRAALRQVRDADPRWAHPFYWAFTGLHARPAR